jgi:hypothetical protein
MLEKKYEYSETVHQLSTEFMVPMKIVMLNKMCLNETYSKVCTGKRLSDSFLIKYSLKQGYALSPMVCNFTLEYVVMKVQENQWDWN